MPGNTRKNRWLILLFCGYIGIFPFLYPCLPKRTFSESEQRALASMPNASVADILSGDFESDFEVWLSDHVPARNAFVGLNALYELFSGRNGLSGVILGEDGRLFGAPSALDSEAIVRKCSRINAFAETVDLPVSVILIPTSGFINQDALPALHAAFHDSDLATLVRDSLSQDIDFLWPEASYRSIGGDALYYRTDHHYTSYGAYVAYCLYAQSIGMTPREASDYDIERVDGFYGTMYAKSGLWSIAPDIMELWRSRNPGAITVSFDDREASDSLFFPEHLDEMDKYPVFLDGNHALVTIESDRAEGENLLIIRDSFGHCFAPFLADDFQRISLVDLRYYRLPVSELVRSLDIDRVLVLYGADTFLTDTNLSWLK